MITLSTAIKVRRVAAAIGLLVDKSSEKYKHLGRIVVLGRCGGWLGPSGLGADIVPFLEQLPDYHVVSYEFLGSGLFTSLEYVNCKISVMGTPVVLDCGLVVCMQSVILEMSPPYFDGSMCMSSAHLLLIKAFVDGMIILRII